MATVALTDGTFERAVAENDIMLVDFRASWWWPYRQFGPVFEAAARAHSDIVFGAVDTEAEQGLAAPPGITPIPTPMAFREGNLVYEPGALPAAGLEEVITAVRGLDMDHVHRLVAEQADDTSATKTSAGR